MIGEKHELKVEGDSKEKGQYSKEKGHYSKEKGQSILSYTSSKNSSRFVKQERPLVNPCWLSFITLYSFFKCSTTLSLTILSITLHTTLIRLTGLYIVAWITSVPLFEQWYYEGISPFLWYISSLH